MLFDRADAVLAMLLLALAIDWLIGDPDWLWRRWPHPAVLLGRLIQALERLLLDVTAGPLGKRLAGGALLVILLLVATAIGTVLHRSAAGLPAGWLIEALLLSTLLAWRSLDRHVAAVAQGLGAGLDAGRAAVAHIVGRDPAALDGAGIGRAAIESLAENFSDGVVAPLFWALLGGLPGALAYKAVNTADSMIGHRSARYREFGCASARFDDAINLLPARLSGGLIVISAMLISRCGGIAAARSMAKSAPLHRSPNAGWPEAAMAGALGLRLAGPRRYAGVLVEDAWMGVGRADANANDIRRALRVARLAHALLLASVLAGLLASCG